MKKTVTNSDKTDKVVDWIHTYRRELDKAYSENAWNYFEHERLKMHPIWNGYHCKRCKSMCAMKNKDGLCVKCLVLKEKLDVINKILIQLKGGTQS